VLPFISIKQTVWTAADRPLNFDKLFRGVDMLSQRERWPIKRPFFKPYEEIIYAPKVQMTLLSEHEWTLLQ
jgi:hypothetical protein